MKTVQIAAYKDKKNDDDILVALQEDGSIWVYRYWSDHIDDLAWRKIPSIPEQTEQQPN